MRWIVLLFTGLLLAGLIGWGSVPKVQAQAAPKPNIIFILTDDEDVGIHAFMPKTKALLHDQGTTFSNFFVTYSLCCPSRASILTGQYPHNTQIEGNRPPQGGFLKAYQIGLEANTVAVWLQQAGYHTLLAGKYLNGYGQDNPRRAQRQGLNLPDPTYVPPGWTEWYAGVGNAPYQDYNYSLNENGQLVRYGSSPEDYLTDVIARKAVQAIANATREGKPFFLYLAPFTPHAPANFAPRHASLFKDAELPRPPNFDEADVSDKPPLLRRLPRLSERELARMRELYIKRLRSLQAIDDLVESIVQALRQNGQLANTYIVYTSDNGFHMGNHRMPQGKNMPYEEDIRVPLVVRGPGVLAGKTVNELALNIDLAPTFAEIAGLEVPPSCDGRSLLPLLRGQIPTVWRQSFMVQRGEGAEAQSEDGDGRDRAGAFSALRTAAYTFVQWGSGDRELYDLKADPYQLQNLASKADPVLIQRLSTRLSELSKCRGDECRRVEELPIGTP